MDNVVISCALCNFGKDRFTLRQLDLEDPRLRSPIASSFDGLERLRQAASIPKKPIAAVKKRAPNTFGETSATIIASVEAFFFAGATISSGYVNIPPINGKARWFKLSDTVQGETVVRNGVAGCVVRCQRSLLDRRGIDADAFRDEEAIQRAPTAPAPDIDVHPSASVRPIASRNVVE